MTINHDDEGDNNVIIGNRRVKGNNNVIIDATDMHGNTIINRPMIVGYNAMGGPGDIVIGAGARAGSEIFLLLEQLRSKSSQETKDKIAELIHELKSDSKNANKIFGLWQAIQNLVIIEDAVQLVAKISQLLVNLLN